MTDLVRADSMNGAIEKAKLMAEGNLLPESYRKQPANILWAMEMADALGIPLAMAVTGIDVIKGKPTMKAETVRALILRDGHLFRPVIVADDRCVIEAARRERPDDVQRFEFTMEDAKRSGLAKNPNYSANPKAMLLARASTLAGRAMFADVLMGMGFEGDEIEHAPTADTTRFRAPAQASVEVVDTTTGEITEGEALATDDQAAAIVDALKALNITGAEGKATVSELAGRDVDTPANLLESEAAAVIESLNALR